MELELNGTLIVKNQIDFSFSNLPVGKYFCFCTTFAAVYANCLCANVNYSTNFCVNEHIFHAAAHTMYTK